MIPPDHLAVPDKEHLHHRVRLIAGQGDHILVLSGAARNFLPFADFLNILNQIPVLSGFLKAQLLGCCLHLSLQLFHQLFIIAVEKIQHSVDIFPVFFL